MYLPFNTSSGNKWSQISGGGLMGCIARDQCSVRCANISVIERVSARNMPVSKHHILGIQLYNFNFRLFAAAISRWILLMNAPPGIGCRSSGPGDHRLVDDEDLKAAIERGQQLTLWWDCRTLSGFWWNRHISHAPHMKGVHIEKVGTRSNNE